MRKLWGLAIFVLVIAIAIGVAIFVVVRQGANTSVPKQTPDLTAALWQSYLKNQWLSEGRTVSNPLNSITTSEAQAYTLLRAVWENDRTVFNTTWNWTKNNLMQKNGLFAWDWGKNPNGQYGILTADNGQNSASDADCDIALSLLMASKRWNNAGYKSAGTSIIRSIWANEVVKAGSRYYLAADDIEKTASTPYIVVNPSYFSPYAYRVFAKVDANNQWNTLAQDTFPEIAEMSNSSLDKSSSAGLPPDWVIVDRRTGAIRPSPNPGQSTNFGYNAFRTIWRTALDWQWNHTAAAKTTLSKFTFLYNQWQNHKQLYAIYSHDGRPTVNYSSFALYGGSLPYFSLFHPATARSIAEQQLIEPLLKPNSKQLKTNVDYYDNNWVWFGLKLYEHSLPNLAGGIS